MKTFFTPLSTLVVKSSFHKRIGILLLAVFLIIGFTSTISAKGGHVIDWMSLVIPAVVSEDAAENETATTVEKTGYKVEAIAQPAEVKDNAAEEEVNTDSVQSFNTPAADTVPFVKIVANYCIAPGKVRLTAKSTPSGATYYWSTGLTTNYVDVDIANMYQVIASFPNGATDTAVIKVAQELVVNGDFSSGNTGFYTEYGYVTDTTSNTELYPEGLYGVGPDAHNYHPNFYGREHSTPGQTGNFLVVNGSTQLIGSPARQRIIWQETVSVQPNTSYYLSAQAMNINPTSPAELQFEVNGVLVGTIADLDYAAKPNSDATVNRNNWVRFYTNPTWNSNTDTTATIRIINLNTQASGNDFGLDDISFSTLSPFITLVSGVGTNAQTTCMDAAIAPIVYSVGSDSAGHIISGLPPGITASFDTPNFLTLSGTATASGLYTYSITTAGTCKPVTVTGTINIPSEWNTWNGSVSTDWSDGNNWSCGTIPTSITNALVPADVKKMPSLTTSSFCKKLWLQPSTTLNLNGKLFSIYGGVLGTGVFIGSPTSSLVMDAAGTRSSVRFDQSVPGTTNALGNMTIKGVKDTVLIDTRVAVYTVLAPQNGLLTVNDTLVLRSTATGTARVDEVTGTISYGNTGKVEVERYFPARRSWRLITSPLSAAGSIFEGWQNKGVFTPGKGTYVSGVGATYPVCENGLDWSPMGNASLKAGSSLAPVLNTRAKVSKNMADTSDNIPYFIFVRGDRDPANTNIALSNTTTLSSAGKLQTGRQTFSASSVAGGFTLIGNPYASPVDFNKLGLTNLKKHFWAWDPWLNTEQGGYILIEEITPGNYDMIPRSPGGLNRLIQSSQAFFVETATNGPAGITFQESAKECTSANLNAFRPIVTRSIRADVYVVNDSAQDVLLDGTMAIFDDAFGQDVDANDVIKAGNSKEMLALKRNNKTMTLERRPVPGNTDTLFLQLTKTTQRKYRFEFEPMGIDPILTVFLNDSYTGLKTELSTTVKTLFAFDINGDAGSAAANRFSIVFNKIAAVLPVTFKTVSAQQQAENIVVDWTVENELNIKSYEVEKSTDGSSFEKVNTTAVSANGAPTKKYSWIDQQPAAGNNYYRIKSIGSDGAYAYTKIVIVKIATVNTSSDMQVSPNPASGSNIGITFKKMAEGIYQVKLLNAIGQTMQQASINHTTPTASEQFVPGNKLAKGIYQLVITKPDHSISTLKVIVE